MTKRYYNYEKKAFYIGDINDVIPDSSIEISETKHNELYHAINSGCIIFDNLTYSSPKPSPFHNWIDGEWVLDEEAYKKSLVPALITKRQIMLQLNKIGLYQKIIDLMNNSDHLDLKIEYECSIEFCRKHNFIVGIAQKLSLSDDDIDNLFIAAATF